MSIEKLKEQARRHEQKEEWRKALDQYKKAIDKLAEDDQPDIGLYNRVGDLFVRVGELERAVEHYEQAVDLYVEAELPNNAIAVCKKVIRNVPDRHTSYLKMGQIRAQQGFIPDARTNFLTYAERVAQSGDMEESLRALDEFTDLAPEDVEVRLFLAEQLASHDRTDEAVSHLARAHHALERSGEVEQARAVRERAEALEPGVDLSAAAAGVTGAAAGGPMVLESGAGFVQDDDGIGGDFGEIALGDDAAESVEEAAEDEAGIAMEDFEIGGFQAGGGAPGDEDEDDEAGALPMMDFDSGDEDEDEGGELPMMDLSSDDEDDDALPMMDFDSPEDDEDDSGELPLMDLGDEDDDDPADLPMMELADADDLTGGGTLPPAGDEVLDAAAFGASDRGDRESSEYVAESDGMEELDIGLDDLSASEDVAEAVEEAVSEGATALTVDEVRARLEGDPDDISLHQRMVELAYGTGREADLVEAYLGLGRALDRAGEAVRAKAAYQQVLGVDPTHEEARAAVAAGDAPAKPVQEVAAQEDYVDLGSMILGDEPEKTTRFTVAYEEPSGDEEADFAKMLSQFKDKVSENLGADDVKAHHDLGTAYKEMGLLDEAVAEFQAALRADVGHLPTYELMGQTFLEMGNPGQAVRSLERALEAPFEVEDELLGIYYYLARAYEEKGNTDRAVEFYDRVFSLDINFADVTERLRSLRPA